MIENDFSSQVSVRGKVVDVGFDSFLESYLARLGLELLSADYGDRLMTLHVRGDASLVDMLSMACWLGPGDALVDDVIVDLIKVPIEDDA